VQEIEFNQSIDDIQSLFRSGLSVQVLVAFSDKSMEVRRLSEECKSSVGGIITTLNRRNKDGLMEEHEKMWSLTSCGSLLTRKIDPFIRLFRDRETDVPDHSVAMEISPGDVRACQKSFQPVVLSGHTVRVLLALQDGDTTPEQLRRITGARTSALRPLLNRLSEMGYLTEHGHAVSMEAEGRRQQNDCEDQ
jgi:predicted transcriptional regulator